MVHVVTEWIGVILFDQILILLDNYKATSNLYEDFLPTVLRAQICIT